jgi:hypothetical protein
MLLQSAVCTFDECEYVYVLVPKLDVEHIALLGLS